MNTTRITHVYAFVCHSEPAHWHAVARNGQRAGRDTTDNRTRRHHLVDDRRRNDRHVGVRIDALVEQDRKPFRLEGHHQSAWTCLRERVRYHIFRAGDDAARTSEELGFLVREHKGDPAQTGRPSLGKPACFCSCRRRERRRGHV